MIVHLQTQSIQTIEQVRAFVAGTEPVSFTCADRNTVMGSQHRNAQKWGHVW
jgi:hypothetical protein